MLAGLSDCQLRAMYKSLIVLKDAGGLAPGDFANVARRMRALDETDPEVILRELAREVEAKEGAARPIGFGR